MLPCHVIRKHDFLLILILLRIKVIKRQLRTRGNIFFREKSQFVQIRVGVVVGYGEEAAVGRAGMVHETGGPAEVAAVADVARLWVVFVGEFVQAEEVDVFVWVPAGGAALGFGLGDDFAAVGVDELACFEGFECF